MDDRELPSDSDESDEDYVPSGAESNPPSEVESDGEDEDNAADSEEEEAANSGKRKRGQKLSKKKPRKKSRKTKETLMEEVDEEERVETVEQQKLSAEEEKKKADSLWSDFMKDTGSSPRVQLKSALSNGNLSKKEEEVVHAKPELQKKKSEKENKITITKVFEFAGEEVRVTKEVDADSAEARVTASSETKPDTSASPAVRGPVRSPGGLKGLSSVLGQLGKKPKLGTLEKSKLDWDRFKKNQGIDDDIQAHNRGKDGYASVTYESVFAVMEESSQYIRRRSGEVFRAECLHQCVKHPPSSMVWSVMLMKGLGKLHIVEGTLKQDQYNGILEELDIGKLHEYLEKQDFLQRTDLRQFEREKALRATTRRSNR